MGGDLQTSVHKSLIFEEWAHHLSTAIGHHSSAPLSPEIPFSATMKVAQLSDVSMIKLAGSSSIRLHRYQPLDRILIWLPREGWVHERINGTTICAEPGTATIFLPGDELIGETTASLGGTSILLPLTMFGDLDSWTNLSSRHISEGSEAVSLLECAQEAAAAFFGDCPGKQYLIQALADQLEFWRLCQDPERAVVVQHPTERRALIASAREWMNAHLEESFRITDLAANLHLSPRSLQLCFRDQLGRSPSEELQRLRFRRLRERIGLSRAIQGSLEDLCRDCGLTFTANTMRHYRNWCGETPSQTWKRMHGC